MTKHHRAPVTKAPTELETTMQRLDEACQLAEHLRRDLALRDAAVARERERCEYLSTEVKFLRQGIQHLFREIPDDHLTPSLLYLAFVLAITRRKP